MQDPTQGDTFSAVEEGLTPRAPQPERRSGTEGQPDSEERIRMGQWSGPLPPPAALEQFERSSPGAADRILSMAEREEKHRHEQERKMLSSDTSARSRGQFMAFLIAVVIILGGMWLIHDGKSIEGLIAVLTPLAVLVGLFLRSQSS